MTSNNGAKYNVLENENGRRTLQIFGGINQNVISTAVSEDFSGISFIDGDFSDLTFLEKISNKVKSLSIRSRVDWAGISQLNKIERIYIGDLGGCPLNFSQFPELKAMYVYWNKGFEKTLNNLTKVQMLRILNYKYTSLQELGDLPDLKYLSIAKSTRLETLGGAENFKKLKLIEILNASKLSDISCLKQCKSLSALSIDSCKRFSDYPQIGELLSLEELQCFGNQKDLKWVPNLVNLEKLTFGGKLEDGKLDFLLAMPNLKLILCNDSRNYTPKNKDFDKLLRGRGYDVEKLRSERLRFDQLY